jgi:ribonucleoside-diphosphate reductase alpha chain
LFAISFVRNVLSGAKLLEINRFFEQAAGESGIYSKELLAEIANKGSLQEIGQIPAEMKRVFVTAFDIKPTDHLNIQASFQKYTDNAVSKTINLPSQATVEDVKNIFMEAYRLKCKGITVYRYGSRAGQVLSFGHDDKGFGEPVSVGAEYSGGCAAGTCVF